MSDSMRLSIRWASLTHLDKTASWTWVCRNDAVHYHTEGGISSCQLDTFLTSRVFMILSVSGWVVMSNRRKFCFSVVRTPFSTKFLARRSRTFFSWYLNFRGFHVSPKNMGKKSQITRGSNNTDVDITQFTTQVFNPILDCLWGICFLDMF